MTPRAFTRTVPRKAEVAKPVPKKVEIAKPVPKKVEIKWKLPKHPLNISERLVLDYLTKMDSECGIERTNQAISAAVFPTVVSRGSATVSGSLRILNVMGLVERVRRFGVVYWRRIKAKESASEDGHGGEWIDVSISDDAVFRSWQVCAAFQIMCAKSPDPVGVNHVGAALGGVRGDPVKRIMRTLVSSGYAHSNERNDGGLLFWPSEKGKLRWEMIDTRQSTQDKIMDYLSKHQDRPEMCTYEGIGRECLGLRGIAVNTIVARVSHETRNLLERGLVWKDKHPVDRWTWFRVKGINNNQKGEENV